MTSCPFCDAALTIEVAPPATVPQDRLGRAARIALGGAAALAISVAACDKPKENIAMPYGAPPRPELPNDAASDPVDATVPVATATVAAVDAVDAAPPPAPDAGKPDAGKPKPPPTATVNKQPPPNLHKPYGAPPADGYDFFDV